jgi:hypothetical protein
MAGKRFQIKKKAAFIKINGNVGNRWQLDPGIF